MKLFNNTSFLKQFFVIKTLVLSNPISSKSLISFYNKVDNFIKGTLSPVNYL